MQPAGRSHSWGLRLPSTTAFLKDVTVRYSWSLPILGSCSLLLRRTCQFIYMCWTLKVDDYVMLRKIRRNILVRLPRICPRRFLSFECFNHYSFEKPKACEAPCSPSVRLLCVQHQQQICRCKFLPLHAGVCVGLDGWLGTYSKGSSSLFQRKSYWFKWE